MKILITGDWHFTLKQPGSRRDPIDEVFFDKISQICDIMRETGADFLVQPGDMFDSAKANDETKSALVEALNQYFSYDVSSLLTIYGQHDLRHHQSNISNTPLNLLSLARYFKVLSSTSFSHHGIDFYGASWHEDIPKPECSDHFNVLVMHKMVIDEKLWEAQEDYLQHNIFLKTQKHYDLIISGDNHKTFTAKSGDRYLVNAGCLVRTKIDQEGHGPSVFLFDTETKELKQYRLDIKPFNDVIRFEEAVKEKEDSVALKKYTEALKSSPQLVGIRYRANIHRYIENNKDNVTPEMEIFIGKVFKRADKKE